MGLSAKNPKVGRLRKLSGNRRFRRSEGVFVVDSVAPVHEAVAGCIGDIEALWVDEMKVVEFAELTATAEDNGVVVHDLAADVLARSLDLATSPGIAATVRRRPGTLTTDVDPNGFDLVLVGVSDPGNAGTIVRTAEAMGVQRVIATRGTVDLFSPKVVRSSAGALLRMPVVDDADTPAVLDHLRDSGRLLLGAATRGGVEPGDLRGFDLANHPVALLVGSEAHGLGAEVEDALTHAITIALAGRVESLNVAVATGVIGFAIAEARNPSAR